MRTLGVVVLQVVLAVVVSGLVLPALLLTVPQAREIGLLALILLVVIVFVLLRVAWPARRGGA